MEGGAFSGPTGSRCGGDAGNSKKNSPIQSLFPPPDTGHERSRTSEPHSHFKDAAERSAHIELETFFMPVPSSPCISQRNSRNCIQAAGQPPPPFDESNASPTTEMVKCELPCYHALVKNVLSTAASTSVTQPPYAKPSSASCPLLHLHAVQYVSLEAR